MISRKTTNKPNGGGEKRSFPSVGSAATPRVPGVLFRPNGGRAKARPLLAHPDGIAGLVNSDGTPGPLVKDLIGKGHAVLAIGPCPTGENKNPFALVGPSGIRHFSCYNRGTAAERVQDIADGLGLLTRGSKEPVNLVGLGAAGPLCLLARTQVADVARTVVDANQFDYRGDADLPAG